MGSVIRDSGFGIRKSAVRLPIIDNVALANH